MSIHQQKYRHGPYPKRPRMTLSHSAKKKKKKRQTDLSKGFRVSKPSPHSLTVAEEKLRDCWPEQMIPIHEGELVEVQPAWGEIPIHHWTRKDMSLVKVERENLGQNQPSNPGWHCKGLHYSCTETSPLEEAEIGEFLATSVVWSLLEKSIYLQQHQITEMRPPWLRKKKDQVCGYQRRKVGRGGNGGRLSKNNKLPIIR